jgi:hypothetical protein
MFKGVITFGVSWMISLLLATIYMTQINPH